ncbi:rho GTPase-activating protein 18-like isoform X2 [Ptychodera flava]|uniref:rho GTPase-activating protein 18-like isoform X2 n=1 Tax=Ptychodera flava TaxID=63121 RepID=UPI00396A3A81
MEVPKKTSELDIYLSELKDIAENKDTDDNDNTEDEASKTPDEGEEEVQWLKEAGFQDLASKYEEGKELEEGLLANVASSLTRAQVEAVQKRVDTLNATIRKRRKSATTPDVREIFTSQGSHSSIVRRESRHKRSRTLPDRVSDRPLIKVKELSGIDPGIAEITTDGIKTLSLTHTLPMDVPQTGFTEMRLGNTVIDANGRRSREAKLNIRLEPAAGNKAKAALPNVTIVQDKLGLTPVDSLGHTDIDKIRSLALLELTTMYDTYSLSLRPMRKPGKKKIKEHGLFGVPLHVMVENDNRRVRNVKTPLFFQQILEYMEKNCLDDEGILRIPGSSTRMKTLRKDLESQYSSGCHVFKFNNVRSHDVAGLFKLFLRELPIPLLTLEFIQAFAIMQSIPDKKEQIQALNLLILVLPKVYRYALKLLLQFLRKLIDKESVNKMSLINVAMIMAPNLFVVKSYTKAMDALEMQMAAGTANVVRMLVNYQEILWMVPSFMVLQLRHFYESTRHTDSKKSKDSKYSMTFFSKKGKDSSKKSEYQAGVIKVQAPEFTKISITMQLTGKTTAADVVDKFKKSSFSTLEAESFANASEESYEAEIHLWEVGGNIGQRCLDPMTNLLELQRINPQTEWIIMSKSES